MASRLPITAIKIASGRIAACSLFIQSCHAIQHAHQKGVIHRDIKRQTFCHDAPMGVPVPKVIDFGIAKATEDGSPTRRCSLPMPNSSARPHT